MEGVHIPTSVIVVSIIITIIIVGLTIAHITGGYRIKQTIDEVDDTNQKNETSNSSGERDQQ